MEGIKTIKWKAVLSKKLGFFKPKLELSFEVTEEVKDFFTTLNVPLEIKPKTWFENVDVKFEIPSDSIDHLAECKSSCSSCKHAYAHIKKTLQTQVQMPEFFNNETSDTKITSCKFRKLISFDPLRPVKTVYLELTSDIRVLEKQAK